MIEFLNVTKTFNNKHTATKDITLKIEKGQFFGLVGPNGAGKSTLINLLINLFEPSNGAISIFGTDYETDEISIKQRIGIVPEELPLIDELTAKEFINYIGIMYNIDKVTLQERMESLFKFFELTEEETHKKNIGTFSTGMRKKIALCAAVIHKPDILILDEPFTGLDPIIVQKLSQFLKQFMANDKIVILSSHLLYFVEKLCTHVGVINEGKLAFSGSIDELKQNENLEESLINMISPEHYQIDEELNWLV